jgi:hypothetical protein
MILLNLGFDPGFQDGPFPVCLVFDHLALPEFQENGRTLAVLLKPTMSKLV